MKDYNKKLFPQGGLIPLNLNKVDKIIIHHTEWITGTTEMINDLHKYKGWKGYGYNYGIEKDGTLVIGRGFYIGAQCHGNNSSSFGIALYGDFTKEKPTLEQLLKLKSLIKDLNMILKRNTRIMNHYSLTDTSCPALDFTKLQEMINQNIDNNVAGLQRKEILNNWGYWRERAINDDNVNYLLNNMYRKLEGITK